MQICLDSKRPANISVQPHHFAPVLKFCPPCVILSIIYPAFRQLPLINYNVLCIHWPQIDDVQKMIGKLLMERETIRMQYWWYQPNQEVADKHLSVFIFTPCIIPPLAGGWGLWLVSNLSNMAKVMEWQPHDWVTLQSKGY